MFLGCEIMAAEIPDLNLAIDRLRLVGANHFAVHVIDAPFLAGYVLEDVLWDEGLAYCWGAWQEMFAVRSVPMVPFLAGVAGVGRIEEEGAEEEEARETTPLQSGGMMGAGMEGGPYSVRLMQSLGMGLWEWLFSGAVLRGLSQCQGIAMGRGVPLRMRLDVRDPDLIGVPWEIMQPQAGVPAISLGREILFSRTTSDVGPLRKMRSEQMVNVLVVLGREATIAGDLPAENLGVAGGGGVLKLEQEAAALRGVLENVGRFATTAGCFVDTLVQPTARELVRKLEEGRHNVFFYAGHGIPAPDGGMLLLREDGGMSGTELAGVLVRSPVKLAVFNACWGALPDQRSGRAIPRSSLAEVLLHHGVPAVLAMRDSIADEEALAFVRVFAQGLAERLSIDRSVMLARQSLLSVFKFNQQAWTLPVLYMHPEFDGVLVEPLRAGLTQIPMNPTQFGILRGGVMGLRLEGSGVMWALRGGLMQVGLSEENDVVLREAGVSRRHADLFCRGGFGGVGSRFFLKDLSRYGTWVEEVGGWRKINHEEVELKAGMRLRFGGSQNPVLEFGVMD